MKFDNYFCVCLLSNKFFLPNYKRCYKRLRISSKNDKTHQLPTPRYNSPGNSKEPK